MNARTMEALGIVQRDDPRRVVTGRTRVGPGWTTDERLVDTGYTSRLI